MSAAAISERICASDMILGKLKRAERLSNLHWKMLYLKRRPKWKGRGLVVEKQDQRVTVLIPELALESRIRYSGTVDLNEEPKLATAGCGCSRPECPLSCIVLKRGSGSIRRYLRQAGSWPGLSVCLGMRFPLPQREYSM